MSRYYLILLIFFVSCSPKVEDPVNPGDYSGAKVRVVNEGLFQNGNASVSEIRIDKDEVIENIYNHVNSSALGDVAQSAYTFKNKTYIVVNNSSKIEIVDAQSFQSLGKITNLQSPRYFLPINDTMALVSDLYAHAVSVVDLKNNYKKSSIPLHGWSEQMINIGDYTFITNRWGSALYRVHHETFAIDSLPLSFGANSLVYDTYGKLWVLCGGNELSQNPGAALWIVNPNSFSSELKINFPSTEWPRKLCSNPEKTQLLWLGANNSVYQMPVTKNELPLNAFIQANGKNFYSLGVHPQNGEIYVGDAIDYQQKGKVYRFQSDGTLIKNYTVGQIPTDFIF